MAIARSLTALTADFFIERRAIAIAHRVAAFFAGFAYGDISRIACFFVAVLFISHYYRLRLAFGLLPTFLTDFFVECRAVLGLRGLAAFAPDLLVELGSVFRL